MAFQELLEGGIRLELDTAHFRRQLRSYFELSQEIAEEALVVVAREFLNDSKLYVPVLTGALKDSGHVEVAPSGDNERVVRVVYDVFYAWMQHERPFWHPSLGFYGAARYMELPLLRFADFYLALFVDEYNSRLAQA
jgi:hypothetical protein